MQYSITMRDEDGNIFMETKCVYISDAFNAMTNFPNCFTLDMKTGEVLRIKECGTITYSI